MIHAGRLGTLRWYQSLPTVGLRTPDLYSAEDFHGQQTLQVWSEDYLRPSGCATVGRRPGCTPR